MRAEIDLLATGHCSPTVAKRHRHRDRGGRPLPRTGSGCLADDRGSQQGTGAGEPKKVLDAADGPRPRYEAGFPLDKYGSFLLHAALEKTVDDPAHPGKTVTVAESFGHVTNSYPREYLALAPDVYDPTSCLCRDRRCPRPVAGRGLRRPAG